MRSITLAALVLVLTTAGFADWPAWQGPTHTSVATPSGHELVDDPAKARQMWLSEDELPGARVADGRKKVAASGLAHISGGFASPVAADGRVYLFYTVPNGQGEDYSKRHVQEHTAVGGYGKEKWWIDTDDTIHCFDLETGKTLWKRVYAGAGMNYNAFNKGGPCNLTPVVADGKVYAVGSAGKVYCVEAETGRPVWDSDVGKRYQLQEQLRAACKKEQTIPQYNRDMSATAVVADGVLVTSDFLGYKVQHPLRHFNWADRSGLVGFDATTGERLWHLPKTLGVWSSPTVWRHGDKAYVLAADADGVIRCVDPAAGDVVWQVAGGRGQNTLVAEGEHLLGHADGSLACWKIDADGATKRWSLPASYDTTGSTLPVLHNGHAYAAMKSGRVVCVRLADGKIIGEVPVGIGGFLVLMDGRLFGDVELGHGGNTVYMFNPDPLDFRAMGGVWAAPNATVYMNPLMPACVDGTMVMRVEGGRLARYDLRAATAHAEPQQAARPAGADPNERPATPPTLPPDAERPPDLGDEMDVPRL